MIYVEEISDTERENLSQSFKSFEMKTKVQNKSETKPTTTPEKEDISGLSGVGDQVSTDKDAPPKTKDKIHTKPTLNVPDPHVATISESVIPAPLTVASPVNQQEPQRNQYRRSSVVQVPKVKHLGENDDLRSIEDCLLYDMMKPLFFCMKVSGIFFIKRKRSQEPGIKGWLRNCTLLQAYCLFICSVLLINFLRFFAAFDGLDNFDSVLFFKFLIAIFFYEAMSRAFLAYYSCIKKRGLTELFLLMEKTCYSDGIVPYEVSLKRTMHALLVLTVIMSGTNVSVVAYGMLGSADVQHLFNQYLVPIPSDLPGILAFKVFLIFITLINSVVATLSLTFFSIICFINYKEFEYLCRTFHMKIKDDGSFQDDIEKFRIRHQCRCKVIQETDQIFKFYIANTYLTNIPLLCLLLYGTVYTEDDDDFSYR